MHLLTPRRRDPAARQFRWADVVRGPGRVCLGLGVTSALLAGCGPSPVDMVDQPMTTTPSRAAGEALLRSGDPEEACHPEAIAPEFSGTRSVPSEPVDGLPDSVEVPADPQRVLALGVAAVDTACLAGIQDALVGIGPLPSGTEIYLPPGLLDLPQLDPDSPDLAERAADLLPDLIVIPSSLADSDTVTALGEVAPTMVYDDSPHEWTTAVETIGDAIGRPEFTDDALLFFISALNNVREGRGTRDTQVSVVRFADGHPEVVPPDTFGISVLEAVGANRPPAQRAEGGEPLGPEPGAPVASDELSGDVLLVLLDDDPAAEATARDHFSGDRWQDLPPVEGNRFFVLDRAVWEGGGLVAARAVLTDIDESINSHAPDG